MAPPRARPPNELWSGAAILAAGIFLAGPALAQDPSPAPPPAPPPAAPAEPPAPASAAPATPPAPVQPSRAAPSPPRPQDAPSPVQPRVPRFNKWRGKRAVAPPKVRDVLPPYGTPIASFPGFTRLDDGKTRIFVEVSRKVDVTETRMAGRVSYRLRGATVVQRTNQLSLQTAYFTTPVQRVQLVPAGSDVDVVIELRELVDPTHTITETPRGMVLWVDFPRSVNFGRDDTLDVARPRAKRATGTRTLGGGPVPDDAPPPLDD